MIDELRVGALYRWAFPRLIGGWIVEHVSEARRSTLIGTHALLSNADVFMLVVLDDPGPYDLPHVPSTIYSSDDVLISNEVWKPAKRWHVALLYDRLVWIDDEMMRYAVIVAEP